MDENNMTAAGQTAPAAAFGDDDIIELWEVA